MGNQEDHALTVCLDQLDKESFIERIQVTGRLIKDIAIRIFEQGSHEFQALSFSCRKVTGFHNRIHALRCC